MPPDLKEKKHSVVINPASARLGQSRNSELAYAVCRGIGSGFIKGYLELFIRAGAIDDYLGALTGLEALHGGAEVGIASDRLAADLGDYIARSKPAPFGAAAGLDIIYICALGHIVILRVH